MEKKIFIDTNITAIREGADAIITRNSSDFNGSMIPVYNPQSFLDMLSEA